MQWTALSPLLSIQTIIKTNNMTTKFKSTIIEWYKVEFPTDNSAIKCIDNNATFSGLFNVLDSRKDVYDYIGYHDSLTRERVFVKLAEIMFVDYDYIYEQWLK